MLDERDEQLIATLVGIHEDDCREATDVRVVYGAAHFPAVVRALAGLGYRPVRGGEWLTAIDF
jgi:hypothetical protein